MIIKPDKKIIYDRIKPSRDCMPEECGIVGVYMQEIKYDPAEAAYLGLFALQHRGQESAGIATSNGDEMFLHRGPGLCTEVFKDNFGDIAGGHMAIGHVRYSSSESRAEDMQPLVMSYANGKLAIADNGALVNADIIKSKLEEKGAVFQTNLDTEIMSNLIARNMREYGDIIMSVKKMMEIVKGSYAVVMMTDDMIIGIRDPQGIRPLALGKGDFGYVLASESCAFDTMDVEFVRDIHPGEIVTIDKNGLKSYRAVPSADTALCIFEYVYFARPDSDIDGISVYRARENMGRFLAKRFPVDADLVGAVPDSATPAGMGYAIESCLPFRKALAKNRYVGRTFIKPQQSIRERSVKLKLNAMKRNVHGKRVVLVDDSIVRGTTCMKIVEMLKLAGAKEVHMRISSPPVIAPCYFGIDTPSHEHLIGAKHSTEEICKIIGADSLGYLSEEDLLRTVEGASCNFCMGCFTGKYPMDIKRIREDTANLEL